MTVYLSEKEMLDRYCDGLSKAAARAGEFFRSPQEKRPKLFIDFIEGIKVAAGSAHQLAHAQENPKWLEIRDKLEQILEVGKHYPPATENRSSVWIKVKGLLENMEIFGRKLGTSKAMTRIEVLANINARELKNNLENKDGKPS